MAAFVEYLVAHEALLRIAFIDLFEVGPAMVGRMTRSVEGFTKLLDRARPRAAPRARRRARSDHRRAVGDHLRLRRRRGASRGCRARSITSRSPCSRPTSARRPRSRRSRPRASRCAPSEQTLRSWAAMIESSPPKRPRRVGHKGAAHIEPGNTLASFDAALRHDVDMIELDVLSEHADGSGRLLVAHDHEDARASARRSPSSRRSSTSRARPSPASSSTSTSSSPATSCACSTRCASTGSCRRTLVSGMFPDRARADPRRRADAAARLVGAARAPRLHHRHAHRDPGAGDAHRLPRHAAPPRPHRPRGRPLRRDHGALARRHPRRSSAPSPKAAASSTCGRSTTRA